MKGRKNQVYWLILFKIHAPGYRSAFPTRIRDRQINADPSGSGSTRLFPRQPFNHGKMLSFQEKPIFTTAKKIKKTEFPLPNRRLCFMLLFSLADRSELIIKILSDFRLFKSTSELY
jgi:hypothetical protein